MRTKAIGYIKIVTGPTKGRDISTEDQEKELRAYAEAKGLELVGIYREKALGGTIVNKDEIDGIYTDIREGNAETILIYKGGRITKRWSFDRIRTEMPDRPKKVLKKDRPWWRIGRKGERND